jgi:glycosyltransferase involved in cell wall biosynthesis
VLPRRSAIGTNYNVKRYTKNTLFDEKIGGTIHLALGAGYSETGNKNRSGLHWDMVCDLRKGGELYVDGNLIQKNGRFLNKKFPQPLKLVFEKQYQCVRHSTRIVVPSAPMRDVILRCYPWCATEKIVVVPWGNIAVNDSARPAVAPYQLDVSEDEMVIITLSRLSPEKGIERLLVALPHLAATDKKVRVLICGGPAYMKGRAYERKLHRLAALITTTRVEFTGHVTGAQKAALLQRADIFVSPSKHESYGLTIAEAVAAQCRVVSHPHYGAEGEIVDCADPKALATVLGKLIATGRTAKIAKADSEFPSAAVKMATLLTAIAELPLVRAE